MTADKAEMPEFIQTIPHSRRFGHGDRGAIEDGMAEITMPMTTALSAIPKRRVIHGGAVSALMDTCGGAAVMSHPDAPAGTATIDLRIDYMRAATPARRSPRAEVITSPGPSPSSATACDEDSDRPVATATGAFTVEGR